jgi:hypothetical protein
LKYLLIAACTDYAELFQLRIIELMAAVRSAAIGFFPDIRTWGRNPARSRKPPEWCSAWIGQPHRKFDLFRARTSNLFKA